MTSPVTLAVALIALALLAFAAVRWRRSLVMSLPFLAIFNGVALRFAGWSFHLDQVAASMLVVPLVAALLIGARRLRTDSTVWWLAAILAVNLVATVQHSPARSYSIAQCANLASAWAIYPLVLNFVDTREELDTLLRRVLWASIVGSCIGIGAYLLAVSGFSVGGADVSSSAAEFQSSAYGAYGTMVEPNILGGFAAGHLVLAVALLAAATRQSMAPPRQRLLRWVVGCTAVALLFSFTRAAWLAAAAGLVFVFVAAGTGMDGLRGRLRRIAPWVSVAVVVTVVLVLLPGDAGTLFRFKLLNLVNLGSQTAVLRLVTYGMALQQWLEHPIIGWGTFTFAPLVAQGADFQQFENWRHLWIGNYLLLALHDTGIVGLGLWLGLLTSIVRRGIRAVRVLRRADPVAARTVFALGAAVAVLLVAFLSTSGFTLGYSWLLIGLLGAFCQTTDSNLLTGAAPPDPTEQPAGLGERTIPAGL